MTVLMGTVSRLPVPCGILAEGSGRQGMLRALRTPQWLVASGDLHFSYWCQFGSGEWAEEWGYRRKHNHLGKTAEKCIQMSVTFKSETPVLDDFCTQLSSTQREMVHSRFVMNVPLLGIHSRCFRKSAQLASLLCDFLFSILCWFTVVLRMYLF